MLLVCDQLMIERSLKRLTIKDVRRGEGGCPVLTFCRQGGRGSSDADVRTFSCKKYHIFQNLWCARTDKG